MYLQWDETLVLALAGMSRLLRAHLRTLLAVVPRFGDGWEELMLVVESCMAGGRHETAVAAVALLSNVLQVAVQRTSVTCLGAVSTSKRLPLCACDCHFLAAPTRRKGLHVSVGGPGPRSARLCLTPSVLRLRRTPPRTLCRGRCGSGRCGRWEWASRRGSAPSAGSPCRCAMVPAVRSTLGCSFDRGASHVLR